jgi:hypothetical protein
MTDLPTTAKILALAPPEPRARPADAWQGPTWRYRLLLRAIGSNTLNGSDLTLSDRHVLLGIDRRLVAFAAAHGEDAAHKALVDVIDILEADPAQPDLEH